jgi:anti-sigma B factor antagonist
VAQAAGTLDTDGVERDRGASTLYQEAVMSGGEAQSQANGSVDPFHGSGQQLVVQDVIHDARHTLVLDGELDIASRPLLDDTLMQVVRDETTALTLDLAKVSFMDSTGLHAVLAAKALCAQHGCEFGIVRASSQVRRVFELSGLLAELPVGASTGT